MRLCLTAVLASLSLAALSNAALADVQITVDKGAQQMSVAVDGQPRYTWPVSTGAGGYDTPGGTYQPFRMEATHLSREWDNAPMPHAIFFTKVGHAIHGTNHVKNLGRAASHGCVRLSTGNAATLFNLVKSQGMAHTRVTIEGSDEPSVAANGAGYRGARRANYDADGYADQPASRAGRRGGTYRAQPATRAVRYRDPFGGDYDGGYGYTSGYGYGGY